MLIRQSACPRQPVRMLPRCSMHTTLHPSRRGKNPMEQKRVPRSVWGADITMVTYLHLITLPQTVPWQSGQGSVCQRSAQAARWHADDTCLGWLPWIRVLVAVTTPDWIIKYRVTTRQQRARKRLPGFNSLGENTWITVLFLICAFIVIPLRCIYIFLIR